MGKVKELPLMLRFSTVAVSGINLLPLDLSHRTPLATMDHRSMESLFCHSINIAAS